MPCLHRMLVGEGARRWAVAQGLAEAAPEVLSGLRGMILPLLEALGALGNGALCPSSTVLIISGSAQEQDVSVLERCWEPAGRHVSCTGPELPFQVIRYAQAHVAEVNCDTSLCVSVKKGRLRCP